MYKCKCCGWVGKDEEIPGKDFREDYGDVYLQYCPNCKQVDWDPGWLFEEVEDEALEEHARHRQHTHGDCNRRLD